MWRRLGSLSMAAIFIAGYMMVLQGRNGLYMGLILIWAVPFALLLWYVSSKIGVFNSVSDES